MVHKWNNTLIEIHTTEDSKFVLDELISLAYNNIDEYLGNSHSTANERASGISTFYGTDNDNKIVMKILNNSNKIESEFRMISLEEFKKELALKNTKGIKKKLIL